MKIIKVILFLSLINLLTNAAFANFTISAEVEQSASFNINQKTVHDYFLNLNIYPKYFPDMVSVTDDGNNKSEWTYKVDYPLSPTWDITFDEKENDSPNSQLVFESDKNNNNYLYCRAVFKNISETQTGVDITIKVTLTREKASDIHFLAGIMGEKLISEKMKSKLEDDLQTFIGNISGDIYKKN